MGQLNNVFVRGFNADQDLELDDAGTAENYIAGDLSFENWEVVLPEGVTDVTSLFNDTTESTDLQADAADFSTAVDLDQETVGADLSVFGWTYASQKGAL